MTNPTAAMLVIGDEILSGRTRDSNMHHLAQRLTAHGIDMTEMRVVRDERAAITDAVTALSAAHTHVFTSGGIGPTHDDITADCVAAAFGKAIDVRDDARAVLQAHYDAKGIEMNESRLRMARIPEGATLIDNPVSAAPGFTLGNVHVMAGVPRIFEAMVDGLLARLEGGTPPVSRNLTIRRGEGDVAGPLRTLAGENPALSFGSYPFADDRGGAVNVVVRGAEPEAVDAAIAHLAEVFPDAEL